MEYKFLNDCCKQITDYVASGSFASLKANVKITNNPDYAIMVKTADFSNNFTKDLTYTDKHGYDFLHNSNLFGGELILSNIGSIGKVFIVPKLDKPMTLASNTIMVRPNDDFFTKYLFYFFLSPNGQNQLDKISSATSMRKFNKTQLKTTIIPAYSIEKQGKIVSILDKINAIIDADKKQLDLLDETIKSRFIEMFDSIEKKVPLKEICSIEGGYSFKSTDICRDGIKLLQIGNVALNDLDWSTTNYLPVGFEKQRPNFLLKEDDIVVALTRPIIQSLGNVKACIVKQEDLPCLLNQRVGKIQCIEGKSVVNYIFGCLMTEDFTEYVKSCCTGCSQPNISTKDIESYQVPNVNIESQLAFSNFKKLIDKSKFNVQQHLNLMQELLDKKMDEYFGE